MFEPRYYGQGRTSIIRFARHQSSIHSTPKLPRPCSAPASYVFIRVGFHFRLRVTCTEVAPWPRAEHMARVEGHHDRGGDELGCGVQPVEHGLLASGVLGPGSLGEEGCCRAAEDGYAVHANYGLGRREGLRVRKALSTRRHRDQGVCRETTYEEACHKNDAQQRHARDTGHLEEGEGGDRSCGHEQRDADRVARIPSR